MKAKVAANKVYKQVYDQVREQVVDQVGRNPYWKILEHVRLHVRWQVHVQIIDPIRNDLNGN